MVRRRPLLLAAAGTAAAAPFPARGQDRFPSRPVRFVVPFAAGGIIDVAARIVAEALRGALGGAQPVVVENQPGGGSIIGARTVARAAPDGHTLLVNGAAHSVIPALYPDAGFDALRDLAPVALLGQQPFLLAVYPGVPATDTAGFLASLRERRGDADFATTGVGSASHLAGELLKRLAGVDFTVVPYRGTPAAVSDLVAGRVHFMIDSQTLLAPLGREGRVRLLAATTPARSRLVPDLPTLREAGVPGYDASSWQALYAPAGTPAAVLDALWRAAEKALADAEVQRRYAEVGLEAFADAGPAAATDFLRREAEKWGPILQATGAKPSQ